MQPAWGDTIKHSAAREARLRRAAHDRQQELDDHSSHAELISEITNRNERAEEARELRAEQERCAERFHEQSRAHIDELQKILANAAAESARTVAYFRQILPDDPTPTLEDVSLPPRPSWDDYAPTPPTFFGRRRFERERLAAQHRLDDALRNHDAQAQTELAALVAEHRGKMRARSEAHRRCWDDVERKLTDRDGDTISDYIGSVLSSSPTLREFIAGGRATYESDPRELVIELDLPDTDVIPSYNGWRYVAARKKVEALPVKEKEAIELYVDFVAQISLAIIKRLLPGRRPGSD